MKQISLASGAFELKSEATVAELLARKGLMLKAGTAVDATVIAAPSSTKNKGGKRDPAMHQTKKGNRWRFGMKAHIGVDADSGLVHTLTTTAANARDVTEATKRQEVKVKHPCVHWHVAMMPGKRRRLDKSGEVGALIDALEQVKASVRSKVEHPLRALKRQFGYIKVRYRGLAKNTADLHALFALVIQWLVRKRILQGAQG